MEALRNELAAIRRCVPETLSVTQFSPELERGRSWMPFGDLDLTRTKPIRFRSSTNVEDSEQFTGAGLYDSYSGCLADDLDSDSKGPCACDPTETNERGVFRAIRKVFASFYNDNAFLERLKHGVDESQVGMALLVHHSYPDEIELANGVATLERSRGSDWTRNIVSQKGAVSVTNPPMDAVPEEVTVTDGVQRAQSMARSAFQPRASAREYRLGVGRRVHRSCTICSSRPATSTARMTQKEDLVLDFEFKKSAPEGKLEIKQIREIPKAGGAGYATPFLLGESQVYCTFQGRGSNVFANHRLKSRWTIRPKSSMAH